MLILDPGRSHASKQIANVICLAIQLTELLNTNP
jgi:hypothetical protein